MANLELRFLGGFEVTQGDKIIQGFDTDKTRALLAYLTLESAHPHRREILASLLWPDRPERTARTSLRQAIYRLRQALGDRDHTILSATRQDVRFNVAAQCYLDVNQFTDLLARCCLHASGHQEPCAQCALWQQQAIALYRGDFLAGLSVKGSETYEMWRLTHQEVYHRLALDALYKLAAYHQACQDYLKAWDLGERLVQLEPWHEGGHRVLMRALAKAGQRNAALHQFEMCRSILISELGVSPSQSTTRLYQAIRDEDVTN